MPVRPFKSSLFFSPAIPPRLETFAACSDHIVANDKVGLDLITLRSVAQRLLSAISFASSSRWKGGFPAPWRVVGSFARFPDVEGHADCPV